MDREEVLKAYEIYDRGLVDELHEYIKPFLDNDDPYALYFYSTFSLAEWDESLEEMDKRRVELLIRAAKGDVPEAMYQLSALYFVGDTVDMDVDTGKRYLNNALDLNYKYAKWSVGINTYYGSNGYEQDIEKAIELISEAEKDDVEGASEMLVKILKEKED